MRTLSALFAASMFLLVAAAANAGVVLQEKETIDHGTGQPETQDRTVMVQGNQQKTVTTRSEVLIDLDKGVMYVISPERKAYVQMAFPPEGWGRARRVRSSRIAGSSTIDTIALRARACHTGYSRSTTMAHL